MKDRRSTSKNNNEPPRPKTIPDDFIWDPEIEAWYPPGEPSGWDAEAWTREFQEEMNNLSEEDRRGGLISVDELRAAGALDVPPARRKSLGTERDLLPGLFGDDDPRPEKQQSTARDLSADEDE